MTRHREVRNPARRYEAIDHQDVGKTLSLSRVSFGEHLFDQHVLASSLSLKERSRQGLTILYQNGISATATSPRLEDHGEGKVLTQLVNDIGGGVR